MGMGWAETIRVTQGSSPLGCSVRVWKCCQAAEEGWGQPWGSTLAGSFCWPHPPRPTPRSYGWAVGEELAWFIFTGIKFAFQTCKLKGVFIFSLAHHLEVTSFPAAPHSPARLPDT